MPAMARGSAFCRIVYRAGGVIFCAGSGKDDGSETGERRVFAVGTRLVSLRAQMYGARSAIALLFSSLMMRLFDVRGCSLSWQRGAEKCQEDDDVSGQASLRSLIRGHAIRRRGPQPEPDDAMRPETGRTDV